MRRFAASLVSSLLAASMLIGVAPSGADAAISPALRRYPYLTDLVLRGVTVNWATTTSVGSGSVRWGPPGHCSANRVLATKRAITVGTVPEYQWKARIT